MSGPLVEAAKAWAAGQRLEFLIVWPGDDGVDFYRRHGFEQPSDPLIFEVAGE